MRAAIIVRLSREDLNQPGTTEDKVARHLAIAQELAARHGLPPVAPEDIYTESGISGRRLSKRPDTLRMLDRCRTGYYTHVVTAYQSRILRGDKRDEADVEDAFLDGCITLITSESVICFDDSYEASNALLFEIRAATDRNYLRDVSKKLREANRQRTLRGQRSAGMAPYGYVWKVARHEDRKQIDVAHYELQGELEIADVEKAKTHFANLRIGQFTDSAYLALARRQAGPDMGLLPGVKCISGEYAILCEIFQRIRSEGYAGIVRSLNQRSIPTAGAARFHSGFAASVWHDSTLRAIVRNLHYSGFPAHAVTTDRKGRKCILPAEKHTLPAEEQSYPHPLRLPDHRALLEAITARATPGSARPHRPTLLTGILKCAQGRPCRANSTSYDCRCDDEGRPHQGAQIRRDRADRLAVAVLREALSRLPAKAAPASRDSHANTDEMIALDRQIRGKRKDLADLERHAATFARSGGGEAFRAAIDALRQEIEALRRKYSAVESDRRRRESAEALTALERLRRVDFDAFWAAADAPHRRRILALAIQRITIEPQPRGKYVKQVTVTMQPWIERYYDPGTIAVPVGSRPI